MGLAALIVYVTLGRRRIDYRYVLAGAVLPDVAGAIWGVFAGGGDRGPGHSLLSVIALAVLILLGFRGEARLAVFGIPVGWLLHLVGDGMWQEPRTFLWPAFGTAFGTGSEPYSWDLFIHPWEHLSTWGGEIAGFAILAWFWIAFRLGQDGRARLFARDGYLRP